MKFLERREIKNGLIQITTPDERFYWRAEDNKDFYSSTWICSYTPAGAALIEFFKREGQNADVIRDQRGDVGRKVHQAIELLVSRKIEEGKGYIDLDTDLFQDSRDNPVPLNGEECEILLSWVNWWKELNEQYEVKILEHESTGFNEQYGYAGTRDLRVHLTPRAGTKTKESLGGTWTIDYKTSKSIYTSHEAQLASYGRFPGAEKDRLAILQIGYKLNKRGYKFTEIPDKWNLFVAAYEFFLAENVGKQPKQFQIPQLLTI